nr:immunoglobulin light chain junction region [Macaca mulatta]MOW04577.1 immunoglobulin light chain junction region [Macaca mulatta]MOW06648.1 immunoglobulin light chain junction region [Macaca mulatta]MOW66315.1 immunoglobulin light chain junction region [Macaca mulatta]MOW66822.1 immunoglobulin light chain junction region [Macaca mulatta]
DYYCSSYVGSNTFLF